MTETGTEVSKAEMTETEHEPGADAGARRSERYELDELFDGEAPENLHFLQVGGQVLLVALIFLALFYAFTKLTQ